MVYSDTTNEQGLVELARNLVKVDSDIFPEKLARSFLNNALDDYVTIAISSNKTWQFDDSAYTNYPIAVTNIVANQYDYPLDTTFLTVERVEIKDSTGVWRVLTQIDEQKDLEHISLTDRHAIAGLPTKYYLKANSIFLMITPDTSVTGGLKVFYQRNVNKFDGTAGTVPGIPNIHHPYLAYKASLLYAVREGRENKNDIAEMVNKYEKDIAAFFRQRNKAKDVVMTVKRTPSE